MAKIEGKVLDSDGKVWKMTAGTRKTLEGGFVLWTGSWELFDLPPGTYTVRSGGAGQGREDGHLTVGEAVARESGAEEMNATEGRLPYWTQVQ